MNGVSEQPQHQRSLTSVCVEKRLRDDAGADGHQPGKEQEEDLLDATTLCVPAVPTGLLPWEGGEKLERLLWDGERNAALASCGPSSVPGAARGQEDSVKRTGGAQMETSCSSFRAGLKALNCAGVVSPFTAES